MSKDEYELVGGVYRKKKPTTTIGDVLGGIMVIFIVLMVIGAIVS